MRKLIESKIKELKAMSFDDLASLSPYRDERVTVGSRRVTVAMWKDVVDDQTLRIVIQAYRPLFLGLGRMDARGFVIDSSGKSTDLLGKDLYDFT